MHTCLALLFFQKQHVFYLNSQAVLLLAYVSFSGKKKDEKDYL